MGRPVDTVRVENEGKGAFDAFTTLDITNDMTNPSEAAFEIGDDGTWNELESFVAMGSKYQVFVNSRLMLTGRVELNNVRADLAAGGTVRMTVRTKLADAAFCSANPNIRVKNITLQEWIVKLYEPLGYTASDFVFKANAARDLITGKPSRVTLGTLPDPDKIQEQAAKPVPPETIFAAADRHLRRFGLMHWDSPDGKIVVSAPDDGQEAIYHFRHFLGPQGADNNVLDIERAKDFSGIPSVVAVTGTRYDSDGFPLGKTAGYARDDDVLLGGFFRPVLILGEQMRTDALAEAAAHRELSARSQKKDAIDVSADGLSHWDGDSLINYAIDTVADVVSETMGGMVGNYYVTKTMLSRRPEASDTSRITMLKEGIWRLR
jgi:prophage tail gpP-like protein